MWIKLTINLQLIRRYRFIVRDESYITDKYPELTKKFTEVILTTHQAIKSLDQQKITNIDSEQLDILNNHLHLLYTQWRSNVDLWHQFDLKSKAGDDTDPLRIDQGVNQMLSRLNSAHRLPY